MATLRRVPVLVILVMVGSILLAICLRHLDETPSIIEQIEQIPSITERKSLPGKSFIIELPIANCDSDKEVNLAPSIEKKYAHELEVVPASDSGANPAMLARAVRKYYQVESLIGTASCTVNASVPADSISIYRIEWTEVWREGDIEIGEIDDNPEATYRFLEGLTGEVVSIKTAACP